MNILLLILGMALVTYIPRVIPGFVVDKVKFGKRLGKFLNLIPFTAMTALIFPGVLGVDAEHIYIGIVGMLTAVILSCIRKIPPAVVVIGSVLSVMAVYLLVP